jgi:hypothetical protein
LKYLPFHREFFRTIIRYKIPKYIEIFQFICYLISNYRYEMTTLLSLCFYKLSFTIHTLFMRNQRRIGEAIMIASGLGLALGASILGMNFLAYGGLAITGLGIVSALWR